MTLRSVLRARLHTLTVTSIFPVDGNMSGSLRLCPRLCWAAELVSLEQVEISNLVNGRRAMATIVLGEIGEVTVCGGASYCFAKGDSIIVTATAMVSSDQLMTHCASIVWVDQQRNAALEISRPAAKPATWDAGFTMGKNHVVVPDPVPAP